MDFLIILLATWSVITDNIVRAADDSDYDYLESDMDDDQKPADVFWGDVLGEDDNERGGRDSPGEDGSQQRRNCSTETAIIDKLLNGTGYNKYRLPCKFRRKFNI